MIISEFCWQPVTAIPFYYRLTGEIDEILPCLNSVFGRYQISESTLHSALKSEGARLFGWQIERDYERNLWRATAVDGTKFESEPVVCSDLAALVTQIEYGWVLRLFYLLDKPFFGLHGAFLSKKGRGVIIIGPKEAGKSTLSCALWQHGWRIHADDLTLLDEKLRPHPNPRRVSLRHSSRGLLGEELWQRILTAPSIFQGSVNVLFHPSDLEQESETGDSHGSNDADLTAIVFLARTESSAGPAELQKIVPASAIFSFLPYSTLLLTSGETSFMLNKSDWGDSIPKLTALVEKVPVYDLGRGPLDRMVARVESLIE